jgi:hypothetical protein
VTGGALDGTRSDDGRPGDMPPKSGPPDPLVHPGCTQRGLPLWHRARAQYHGSDCACAGNRCRAANLTEARIRQEFSYSCPCKGGGGWGVTSLERGNLAARGKSPPEGCPATPVRARRFEDEAPSEESRIGSDPGGRPLSPPRAPLVYHPCWRWKARRRVSEDEERFFASLPQDTLWSESQFTISTR